VRRLASDNGYSVPREFDRALEAALEFSLHVHQPSGVVPSFSDGDVRGFLPLLAQGAQLFDRGDMQYVATGGAEGTAPSERVAHFPNSGYHVLRSDLASADAQHLVFDCGPLGEGNHGHFDALSFELAAFGRALVVDPARYTYSESGEDKNWRVHFRSTAAHNTVGVDGLNQTRYLPKPIKEASRHAPGSVRHKISGPPPETTLQEAHSGARLDLLHGRCASHEYDAVHERCIVFVDRRYWIVSDWLRAPSEHDYLLNFQLAVPQALQWQADGNGTLLVSDGLSIAQPLRSGQQSRLDDRWVSQRYGHKQGAIALRTQTRSRNADFDSVLLPWRGDMPHLRVTTMPAVNARGERAEALRIEVGDTIDGWFHARGGDAHSPWQIGDRVFSGRWLHWREDAQGRLLRAVSHAGASLHTAGGAWPLECA
jgi:Heparinase II/III-like protein